jgi:hypothetical protein
VDLESVLEALCTCIKPQKAFALGMQQILFRLVFLEHMQRICRASLEDLPHARQRRQIIRLQGIRRMLEDLHRQIRQLQTTVQVHT